MGGLKDALAGVLVLQPDARTTGGVRESPADASGTPRFGVGGVIVPNAGSKRFFGRCEKKNHQAPANARNLGPPTWKHISRQQSTSWERGGGSEHPRPLPCVSRLTWMKRLNAMEPTNPPGARWDTVSPSDLTCLPWTGVVEPVNRSAPRTRRLVACDSQGSRPRRRDARFGSPKVKKN